MTQSDKKSSILIVLVGLFCGLLVASNAAGAKIIDLGNYYLVGNLSASATVVSYSATFLLIDIVSEFYGKRSSYTTVITGFFAVLCSSIFFKIAVDWPPAADFHEQVAYESVFGVSLRIFAGGLTAYIVSQCIDVTIYYFLKLNFEGKMLWLRVALSTTVAQFIDTAIFISIAFYGMENGIINLIFGQYIFKFFISLASIPFMYISRYLFRTFVLHNSMVLKN